MKRLILTPVLLAVLFAGCTAEESATTADAAFTTDTPNILLIIGDDMGFSDIGVLIPNGT